MLKIPRQDDLGAASVTWLLEGRGGFDEAAWEPPLRAAEERVLAAREGRTLSEPDRIPGQRLPAAWLELGEDLRGLLEERRRALEEFHRRTLPAALAHESPSGDRCKLLHEPLRRVGILLPAEGLSVSLLLALTVPALVAGVPELIVAMGPGTVEDVPPGVLAAAEMLGVRHVLARRGADAVFALACGTPSLQPVELIVGEDGPAARAAMRRVATRCRVARTDSVGDFVCLTDGWDLDPVRLASEILCHAELGGKGLRGVLCSDRDFADRLVEALEARFAALPRGAKGRVRQTLREHGRILTVRSLPRAAECSDALALQRLCVLVHHPKKLLPRLEAQHVVQLGVSQLPTAVRDRQPWALPVLADGGGPVTAGMFLRTRVTLRSRHEGANGDAPRALVPLRELEAWAALDAVPRPVVHPDSRSAFVPGRPRRGQERGR